MEEEIKKKKGKFKRGCLGCLGVIGVIIFIYYIFSLFIPFIRGSVYLLPMTYGRVIDKETNKPIRYALVISFPRLFDTQKEVLANEKGEYKVPATIAGKGWKTTGIFQTEYCPGTKTTLTVWFPGYKKYEIDMKKNRLFQKLDIYLERPKITNEAVRYVGVSGGESLVFEKFAKGDKEKFCELVAYWLIAGYKFQAEIIKKNPRTETANKIFKWDPEVAKFIDCDYILDNDLRDECLATQREIKDLFEYEKNQCLGRHKPR